MKRYSKDHWLINLGFARVTHVGDITVAHFLCFSMTVLGELGTINLGDRVLYHWDHRPMEVR